MKVIDLSKAEEKSNPSAIFEGHVTVRTLVDQNIRLALVKFSPGARTKLHHHTHEQVLYITEGEGVLATEKEEKLVKPGMIVFVPAGEKHWHGSKGKTFAHVSITTPGETVF